MALESRRLTASFCATTVVLSSSVLPCESTWFHGSIVLPAYQAVFLSKFCYDYDPNAKVGAHIGGKDVWLKSVDDNPGHVQIASFDDQASSYPDNSAFWGFQCDSQRLKSASRSFMNITAAELQEGFILQPGQVFGTFLYERIRPRMWYVALIDCSGRDRTIEYTLHMTNIRQGWLREFPMDRCTPFWLALFSALYLVLAVFQTYATCKNSTAANKHPLRLLLTSGTVAASLGMLLLFIDSLVFASQGQDVFALYLTAKIIKAWSKFSLFGILILVSKGRCISYPLRVMDMVWASLLLVPFLVTGVALEVWGEMAQSRKYTADSVYCTWTGALIVLTEICLLTSYINNILRSMKLEFDSAKRQFYRCWGLLYTLAFLALPVTALVSYFLAPWVRDKVMVIVTNSVHSVLLSLLVAGLWPERKQSILRFDSEPVVYGMQSELLTQGLEDASPIELKEQRDGSEISFIDKEMS